jgi:hypothetical protein
MDKLIEQKFKKWKNVKDKETQQAVNKRNEEVLNYAFEKIKTQIHIDKYLESNYGFVKGFIYCCETKNKINNDNNNLMCLVYFDKVFGGRINYVHGGASHFICYLMLSIYFDKYLKNKKIDNVKLECHYKRKIEIDSILMVKIIVQKEKNVIVSAIVDDKDNIYVKLIYNLKNEKDEVKIEPKF